MSGCLRITLCAVICCALFLSPDAWPPAKGKWEIPQTVNAMTPLTAVSFRNRVLVSGERVTLLDLCDAELLPEDWRSYMAGIDIGAAPETNTTKIINLQNLRSYFGQLTESQGLKKDTVTLQFPERIVIERRKRMVTKAQIEEIVRGHVLSSVSGKPDDVAIQLAGLDELPALPEGVLTWEILTPFHDPVAGTTGLTIQFYVDGNKAQSVRVTSRVQVFQRVVCALRPLKRNDVVSVEDVVKNQPIGAQILDKAVVVKRGTAVVILFQQEGLKLTAKGQAKEDGSVGDRVRITNVDSKRTLSCRVLDPQTVELIP
jgi:flagella basal body P-ring formation protein FlgA